MAEYKGHFRHFDIYTSFGWRVNEERKKTNSIWVRNIPKQINLEETKVATKNGLSRETGNIGYIRHKTKIINIRDNWRSNKECTIRETGNIG